MTGSYNNSFKIYDLEEGIENTLQLSKSRPVAPTTRPIPELSEDTAAGGNWDVPMGGVTSDNNGADIIAEGAEGRVDFAKKVLHYSWHPSEDVVAICRAGHLFLYNAMRAR